MDTIVVKLPAEKKRQLQEMGERKGLNLSNMVRSLIYAELEREAVAREAA